MSFGFMAPAGMLKRKPPHGMPCNRCGLCCIATLCPLARRFFKRPHAGPCPALVIETDGNTVCGLATYPQHFAPTVTSRVGIEAAQAAAALVIGSGTGCDARFNGEPPDLKFYSRLEEWDRQNRTQIDAAWKTWWIT